MFTTKESSDARGNLTFEDFDLDLRIAAPKQEENLLTNKSGFSDICATLWPSC